jgi:prephenate dehydratase
MPCRGIRGAITVSANRPEEILGATEELLHALSAANSLDPADIASAIFTVTPDLDAAFPAQAARRMGWDHVPLLDAVEIGVPGSLPCCIRVLVNWNTEQPAYAIRHIYLRQAVGLRPDLQPDAVESGPSAIKAAGPNGKAPNGQARASDWLVASSQAPLVVAYQGEPGAYSQEAIYQQFGPSVDTLACHSFDEIFQAVETGVARAALLPVENSQAGSINQAFDLLLDHDLRVTGEVKLRVRHCLLAPPGTLPGEIVRVRSHPQALAQCERYIKNRGWQALPAYDTAGSARELAESPEAGTAAIASALAGQTYGLEVLDAGIEDSADNTTRFFLLGREEPPPGKYNKTSLVFATLHTPGALYNVLGELASRGINLTKIESRPRRNRPWHYVFYVDLEGHWQDAAVHRALIGLLARTAFVKLLGSYPAAPEATDGG